MSDFDLALSARFKHPVRLEVSTEEGRTAVEFDAIFLRVNQDEWDQLLKDGVRDRALIEQKMVGWGRVKGEFNATNLQTLLKIDGMVDCLVRTFMEGNSVAPRKN